MGDRTAELRRDIEQTREHMTTTIDAIGDRVSPGRMVERRWERMKRSTTRARHAVMGTPRTVADKARGGAGDLRHAAEGLGSDVAGGVSDKVSAAGDALSNAPEQAEELITGNPLAAGAVAFGLGVLIGSLAPPAKAETQLAEKVVPALQEEATSAGKEIAGAVKEQAQTAAEQTKEAATQAVAEVKDEAASAKDAVADQAKSAKDEVQEQATSAAQDVTS